MYVASEETELDTDEFGDGAAMMLSGGGKFGAEGCDGAGDRGEDGADFKRLSDVPEMEGAIVGCTVFPLLHVGSEEVMEG